MLGFMEILVLGMVMFLLLKRHSLREWGLALKHSVFEFKKALHEKAEREVKEYRSENGQRLSLKGDSDVR
jgi:Sec-independent protein translocase protein TatA